MGGHADVGQVPEVRLPLVQLVGGRANVEEEDGGVAVDEPVAVDDLDALRSKGLEGLLEGELCGLLHFYLSAHQLLVEWADEKVAVAQLLNGRLRLGANYRVDAAHCEHRREIESVLVSRKQRQNREH